MQEKEIFKIELSLEQWQAVVDQVINGPFIRVKDILNSIETQISAQLTERQAAAEPTHTEESEE